MGMAENTRERGREQAGMTREGRRTMEKVLENTVRDKKGTEKDRIVGKNIIEGQGTDENRRRRTETDGECSRTNST